MLVRGFAFFGGVVFIDPWAEVRCFEIGEIEHQVGDIAFGIDDDGWDIIHGGLLEYGDTQAGFTRTGHTEHHAVGDEILGIIKHQFIGELAFL